MQFSMFIFGWYSETYFCTIYDIKFLKEDFFLFIFQKKLSTRDFYGIHMSCRQVALHFATNK